ncbi:hypothetical protein M0R45_005659 [Rubus argutus]|uniref:Protein kinase domain-containing protein n=1 Tax=Rubus argutus TaxID=59490 RepID=A0AAW1YN91_RUBAR
MCTEVSARLVSRLIILLCLIFTLCQLGSEFKSGCIAQELPDQEASAINEVIWGLSQSYRWGNFSCNERTTTGITCNCNNNTNVCHITEVNLNDMGLTGVISEEVGKLTHLGRLNLAGNQLTGSIPASLGNLSSLYILDLANNQLTGSIPESLGNLKFQVSVITTPSSPTSPFSFYSFKDDDFNLCAEELSQPTATAKKTSAIFHHVRVANSVLRAWSTRPPALTQPPKDESLTIHCPGIPRDVGRARSGDGPQYTCSDPDSYGLFKLKQYDTLSDNSLFSMTLALNQLTGPIPDSLGNLTVATSLEISDVEGSQFQFPPSTKLTYGLNTLIDPTRIMEKQCPRGKPNCAGLGSGLGVLLLLGVRWAHKAMKKRKIIKRRQLFFKRNGGLLLEQQISSGKVNVEKIKLFNSKELEKSTDNFNIDRVLGQGGQGTVFKGMLADGNIVAVKKSKVDDKGKVSEFINEVIILSQINHRNIVRLLGCCLETEVPLLVYEFIPNGTLSQYICEPNEEFPLTWKMRLQIAIEISGALHYLHAAASCPIYHRDIKSTNILLDERYRAKIADFGTSRTVAIDQTHYTTNVHGTFGYMDPEYFQSSQFTEKSDVYSFGVVLVELLTGKKPISAVTRSTEEEQEQEYRSLATYFIVSMQEDRLFNILDARVANEGSKEDIMIVANLARRCLNLNGRNRPTMREVITELEAIKMSNRTHHQGAEFIPEHYPIQQCD